MMLWLIPVLPLLGAAVNGIFGKRLPKNAITGIAVGSVALSFLIAVREFLAMLSMPESQLPIVRDYFTWIQAGRFEAQFGLLLDHLSGLMILIVTGVGLLIHVYSAGYMANEEGFYRYFAYLNLFVFFMLTLVLADNYLLMFVGWEGVGLCSYLLIGFWFTRKSAADAGKKAFVVNRVGDFGFILAIMLIYWTFERIDFPGVFSRLGDSSDFAVEPLGSVGVLTAIGLLLFAGAAGKSAQFPLYVWLPDAMEGPTPVSALIHAATMVTAGVYMVARSSAIYNHAPGALLVVAVVGTFTAIFAASIGLVQTDIKRVLAYSTVSPRIHVSRMRRRRIRSGHVPPDDSRVLQGTFVSRCRKCHPRNGRHPGHRKNGRPQAPDALDVQNICCGNSGHCRHSSVRRLFQQGCRFMGSVELCKLRQTAVARGRGWREFHVLLHVSFVDSHFLRQPALHPAGSSSRS